MMPPSPKVAKMGGAPPAVMRPAAAPPIVPPIAAPRPPQPPAPKPAAPPAAKPPPSPQIDPAAEASARAEAQKAAAAKARAAAEAKARRRKQWRAVSKSNFTRPTPSTRRCHRKCACWRGGSRDSQRLISTQIAKAEERRARSAPRRSPRPVCSGVRIFDRRPTLSSRGLAHKEKAAEKEASGRGKPPSPI